jgi:deoxyribodipyrimidine photo-lyase
MIQQERLKYLNEHPINNDGEFVLYWMQAAQRVSYNHALNFAQSEALRLGKPLLVCFVYVPDFARAQPGHFYFMFEGLRDVAAELSDLHIPFALLQGNPVEILPGLKAKTAMMVTDRNDLREPAKWRRELAKRIDVPLVQVETNVVVPVETAMPKESPYAAVLRPKIEKVLDNFRHPLPYPILMNTHADMLQSNDKSIHEINALLNNYMPGTPIFYHGGYKEAKRRLDLFMNQTFHSYAEDRNDPVLDGQSNLSPYLHFGNISPLEILLAVLSEDDADNSKAYINELLTWRELAVNLVYYNTNYDNFNALPDWARDTLQAHMTDPREYIYNLEQLESAATHDPYWNAAQLEMVVTGKMHGYMRMYWGKKILEWSPTPQQGYEWAIFLNDKYSLDGRDPNGYAGVAWCFGKHDRPWFERPIFGKIRYMNANGLKRKFDRDAYVEKIRGLERLTF